MPRVLAALPCVLLLTWPIAAQNSAEQGLAEAKQLREARRFPEAIARYKAAVQQAPTAYGRLSAGHIRTLNDAGWALTELGEQRTAEDYLSEGLALLLEFNTSQTPWPREEDYEAWRGTLHNNLGYTLYQLGRSASAEAHLRRALAIRKNQFGPDDLRVADTQNNLGLALGHLGLLDKAVEHLEESRRIRVKKDAQSLATGQSLSNLANVYVNLGRPAAESDQALRTALTIYTMKLGENRPETAQVLHNLGYAAQARGDAAVAVGWYAKALPIFQQTLPEGHQRTGATHHNLGIAYLQLDRLIEAEEHLRQALAIREKKLGHNSIGLLMTYHGFVTLHMRRQEWSQAAAAADLARRIVRSHTAEVLPALSDKDQLAFLDGMNDRFTYYTALTLAYHRRDSGDQALLGQSVEWLLNGKAVANQCLSELTLLGRDTTDAGVRSAVRELSTTRTGLAGVRLIAAQGKENDAQLQQLAKLERREEDLKKQIGGSLTRIRRGADWKKLADVQRAITPEGVLVEFVRMPLYNFDTRGKDRLWLPDRYVAWVVPPSGQGDVKLVDLGDAAVIDKAIDAYRDGLKPFLTLESRELSKRQKALTTEMDQLLTTLAQRILHPLLPLIEGHERHWTFCPDGKLWLVPWAALPLPDGAYAVERHRLNFLVSGRDLSQPRATVKAQAPVIIANPAFGPSLPIGGASRGLLAKFLPVASLPGSRIEAHQVAPPLAKYAGAEPRRFLEKDATVGNFKSLKHPSALMLCTHGFFFDSEKTALPANLVGVGGLLEAKAVSNPLLRCGLLLSGCNQMGKGGDDGVLTGLEIIDTDLRGTRLVMLSACDTAVGDVRMGEGVAGLRQAFHIAGAEKVVATLWSIPDRETVQLSTQFFSQLAKGADEAEALRAAQIAVIQYRRKAVGSAHPYYWAAFMLTGH